MSIQKLFTSRANSTNGATFVGERGHMFYDETTGQLRLSDGTTAGGLPILVASTTANLGNLYVVGSTISSVHPNEDLNLDSNGTGNVNIVGKLQILTSTGFYSTTPVLSASQQGNVTVNGNLITNGPTYLNGAVTFVGGTTHYGDVTDNGNLTVNGLTTLNGTVTFVGPTFHQGNLTTNGNNIVNGASYFNGPVTEVGNLTVVGNAVNNGTSVFNGTTYQNGNIVTTGILTIVGNTSQVGNLIITGTTINNGVSVFNGNLTIAGNAALVGNTTVSGNTLVTGNTSVIGVTYLSGNSFVTGNTTVTGTTQVTGNTYVIGNTFVTGTTTVSGNTFVTGQVTTITGNTYLTGNSFITGTSTITGPTTVTGNVTVTGNMFQSGESIFNITQQNSTQGAVEITGDANAQWQTPVQTGVMLHVTGQANLASRIYNDSLGSYALYAGRRFEGTVASPTGVQGNVDLVRLAGGVYTSAGWANIGPARMSITTNEIQTGTNQGGRIEFWTTANSAGPAYSTITRTATVDPALGVTAIGFSTTGNVSAGNVTVTNNESVGGNVVVTGNVTAGSFIDTVTSPTVVSNAYTLDLSTAPNMVILNNGAVAFTVTMINPIPGKRVILVSPGLGGAKVTVNGLTAANSFNNTNQYAGLNGPTGAAVVELIATTTANSGVYLNGLVAK